jgi:dTDP-4-amino-4,6-dideoxygalactose transaminase
MSLSRIYLSPPHLNQAAKDYLEQSIVSNYIAPVGPMLDDFENCLEDYLSISNSLATQSATAAIHLALLVLGVQKDDIVITQSHTHIGSVNPIHYQKAQAIFIDSEADTWNICAVQLARALADLKVQGKLARVKAIMPVHLYGMPAKITEIQAIADEYGIPVIEDAAESLGSTYQGQPTGSFGKMGVYSFNGNKIITTSGGGALVSQDESLINKARFLATQARDDVPHYQHSEIGYNYRLSNVLAGLGRGQMQVLPKRVAQRRANFERYRHYFGLWNEKGFVIKFQEEPAGSHSNRWLSAILVDPATNKGLTREDIRMALDAKNIEARPLWKPMHLQPVFKEHPFFGDGTSEKLFDNGLCLPSGSNLTQEDFTRIFQTLDKLLGQYL